jgi:RNA recognition motif-containing protein
LKEKLKHYGVENVEDLTLVEDSNNLGMNRGFAFLEFSSRSDAMNAFKRLQKRDVLFGVDRPAKVSFADSFIGPGDEIMAQVNIYLTDMLKIYISSKTVSTVSSTLDAAIFGAVYLVSSYCICP